MNDEHGASKANGRWFAVAVDVFNHRFFANDPYSRREAWLWLIAHAAWRAHHSDGLDLKRGDVAVSRSFLAEKWRWSEKAVRYFLDHLRTENMIEFRGQQKGRKLSVASICNYEKYQKAMHLQGPAKGPHSTPTQEYISSTSVGTAREGIEDFLKVGGGIVREPSPATVAQVAHQLGIANAEPLLAAYRLWKAAKRARDPDAMFRKAAPTIFAKLTVADRARCKPLATAVPEITVRTDVRASSALLASLMKGSRYAN